MITHDMLESILLADRIAVLRDGQVIAEGTSRELMAAGRDAYVSELMQTPRRHAEKLRELLGRQDPA
jgi:osmoprotectant transport system ATP-binding protein